MRKEGETKSPSTKHLSPTSPCFHLILKTYEWLLGRPSCSGVDPSHSPWPHSRKVGKVKAQHRSEPPTALQPSFCLTACSHLPPGFQCGLPRSVSSSEFACVGVVDRDQRLPLDQTWVPPHDLRAMVGLPPRWPVLKGSEHRGW